MSRIPAFCMCVALGGLLLACNQTRQQDQAKSTQEHSAAHTSGTAPDKVQAFLQGMVPHHGAAIEMARIALERASLTEIKTIAQAVIDAQSEEIKQMEEIHLRLYGTELKPDEMAHGALGMSMAESGMEMDIASLESAEPFDQAFIDMMIPHHQGAIRMARVLQASTTDAELLRLAEDIITAQSSEIDAMDQLRLQHYGSESPAGGVPAP